MRAKDAAEVVRARRRVDERHAAVVLDERAVCEEAGEEVSSAGWVRTRARAREDEGGGGLNGRAAAGPARRTAAAAAVRARVGEASMRGEASERVC